MTFKKKALLGVTALVVSGSYLAWAKLTSPKGDQKVSFAPAKKECFDSNPGKNWRYCVHIPQEGKTNGKVAYFFHGRNLDENVWNDDTFYTAMIQSYWQSQKILPPMVVTISFGPMWLLTEKGSASESGLLDTFKNEVLPEIEARIGPPKARILVGESMGGLNTLMVGFKEPHLFQRIAALCPAVYSMSPFASSDQINEFLTRTGADPTLIYGLLHLSKDYFGNEAEWAKGSPLHLIETVDPEQLPEMYLSCGLYDRYGNFEGNEQLAQRAQARGLSISWRPLYGGHCAIDIPSLAEFIAKN